MAVIDTCACAYSCVIIELPYHIYMNNAKIGTSSEAAIVFALLM